MSTEHAPRRREDGMSGRDASFEHDAPSGPGAPSGLDGPSGRDASSGREDAPAELDASRLAAVISPLRRALLAATRAEADLPELAEAQIDVLRTLPRGTSRGPAEIADRLRLNRSTVSNLLGAMQSDGLVERTPDPADGRRVVVQSSEKALDLFDRFDTAHSTLVARATAALADDDRRALAQALPALERLCAVLTDANAVLTHSNDLSTGTSTALTDTDAAASAPDPTETS
ncbi:MAG: MarR family transcriptional regulator [Microbacterium sp.]|nr:MarR family transcriptional regulator [Microbacterium sp.]